MNRGASPTRPSSAIATGVLAANTKIHARGSTRKRAAANGARHVPSGKSGPPLPAPSVRRSTIPRDRAIVGGSRRQRATVTHDRVLRAAFGRGSRNRQATGRGHPNRRTKIGRGDRSRPVSVPHSRRLQAVPADGRGAVGRRAIAGLVARRATLARPTRIGSRGRTSPQAVRRAQDVSIVPEAIDPPMHAGGKKNVRCAKTGVLSHRDNVPGRTSAGAATMSRRRRSDAMIRRP